jgi:biopolymer transport protein ExbD
MSSQKQQTLEAWLKDQAKQKSRDRRKKELPDEGGVTINSLMDAVTIILIFLLMNFSTDPMKVTPHEKLQLPLSTTRLNAKEKTTTLTVAADGILVDDQFVVTIKNNDVDPPDPSGLEIPKLKQTLDEVVRKRKEISTLLGKQFKDIITIIAYGETQYRLITKVIYTAGTASFTKFKFAVVKGGQLRQRM